MCIAFCTRSHVAISRQKEAWSTALQAFGLFGAIGKKCLKIKLHCCINMRFGEIHTKPFSILPCSIKQRISKNSSVSDTVCLFSHLLRSTKRWPCASVADGGPTFSTKSTPRVCWASSIQWYLPIKWLGLGHPALVTKWFYKPLKPTVTKLFCGSSESTLRRHHQSPKNMPPNKPAFFFRRIRKAAVIVSQLFIAKLLLYNYLAVTWRIQPFNRRCRIYSGFHFVLAH